MEKPLWRKIDKNTNKPCPRWGHTCCVINQQIVFFGGYADSNYMNDIWTYNSVTMIWEEIQTTGQKPTHRSNCSINYDPQNNRVVVFGGGGPNKQRFNYISLLDWNTKNWTQIQPKQNEPAPWERTYHIAELKFPYLAIFGGEGVTDLDDLWIFNFETLRWTQVKFEQDRVKPCARRFHSSCMLGNEMFIIAGCHGKYRCLSDVYSLDLTPLLETGLVKQLRWVERKLKEASFLSRWGHSSTVYENKIYVFAGRFSSDLNDLLVIDMSNNSLKALKIGGSPQDHPKPRRRHCAGFVGSCMIAFGGFNGQYFNDLHYINVFQLSNKLQVRGLQQTFTSYINKQDLADGVLYSKQGETISIHSALIARHFKAYGDFMNYIDEINWSYDKQTLLKILECLYRGYGKLEQDQIHQKIEIQLPENQNKRCLINSLIIEPQFNEQNMLKLAHQSSDRFSQVLIPLKHSQFQCFLENRRLQWHNDAVVVVNNHAIRVNKTLLAMNSAYFRNIFSGNYAENDEVRFTFHKDSAIMFDVLLNYLMMNVLVVSNEFTTQNWMDLAQLGQILSVDSIKTVCQSQLCSKVHNDNASQLQLFSQQLDLNNLSLYCANLELKNSLKSNLLNKKVRYFVQDSGERSSSFIKLYETIKFDLFHNNAVEQKELSFKKVKSENQTAIQEKENNREYQNA